MVCSARTTLVMRGAVGLSHIRARDELRNASKCFETFWNFVVLGYQRLPSDRQTKADRWPILYADVVLTRWQKSIAHAHEQKHAKTVAAYFLYFFVASFVASAWNWILATGYLNHGRGRCLRTKPSLCFGSCLFVHVLIRFYLVVLRQFNLTASYAILVASHIRTEGRKGEAKLVFWHMHRIARSEHTQSSLQKGRLWQCEAATVVENTFVSSSSLQVISSIKHLENFARASAAVMPLRFLSC